MGTKNIAPISKSTDKIAKKKGIEMPIVTQLYEVLFEGKDLKPALSALFNRNVRQEF